MDNEDAKKVAKWVTEGVEGNITQRKVCRFIVERVLVPAMYEPLTNREEGHCLS
jgi:hypothetical protein